MHLIRRNRILRQSPAMRAMVAETILRPADFIAPLFITEGTNVRQEIPSMQGYYRMSIDNTIKEVKEQESIIPARLKNGEAVSILIDPVISVHPTGQNCYYQVGHHQRMLP